EESDQDDSFKKKRSVCVIECVCVFGYILPDGPVDATLGSDVVLKTLLTNPEYAFMIWSFSDGTDQVNIATQGQTALKVNSRYESRVSVNATDGYLTLRKLTREDNGDYSLTVVSADGTTSTEPVSDVLISSDVSEAVEHNSTVVLTCTAKGSYLKFAWLNGNLPLVADNKRITLKNADTSSTLTVTGILRSDLTGPVYCTATNNLQKEKSAPFNLTVHYGVTISPTDTPRYVRAKSNFNLSCSAPSSSPAASFTWFHGEKQMEATGPVLTLEVIQKLGLGKKVEAFSCKAENAKTRRVIASSNVHGEFLTLSSPPSPDAISGVKLTGPGSTLVAGNSSTNLSCKATAGTVATTTWLKDGAPLSASGGRLVFSEDKSSLKIQPLQKEDGGEYKCQLTNPVSSEHDSFRLVVNFGPEPAAVQGKDAVEVNDPVTLTCSAQSVPPASYTWKLNGTLTAVKTAEYVIEKASFKNSGTYTCEAHNAVTGQNSTYSHTLAVKEGDLDGLSDGAIAGIVIAILVALAAAIGLTFYCRQKVP
uniref:Ig-like domain-containing protein n=1 Tax=Cynoglossus semilaevis TaxID=244447 RepID=A0A3P8WT36_CYNSE